MTSEEWRYGFVNESLAPASDITRASGSDTPRFLVTCHSSLVTPRRSLITRHSSLDAGYWRSLEEFAKNDQFQEFLHREFPERATEWHDSVGRREFLKLMAASLALAGLNACTRQPAEKVLPYVRQPEEIVPGRPLFFATAMSMGGVGTGLLVESHEGRPTKIEGNPDHPASFGATDAISQASILGLYDPDRSQTVTYLGDISTWPAFLGGLSAGLQMERGQQGAGLRLLTETITSPTMADQIQTFLKQFPAAKWHKYEPAMRDGARAGARIALGQVVDTIYRLEAAEVILSLDADFFSTGPGHLRYVREFMQKRRVDKEKSSPNRLYVVESTPSITGGKADHRIPVRASEIEAVALAVAVKLGAIENRRLKIEGSGATTGGREGQTSIVDHPSTILDPRIDAIARDLQGHAGSCLIIPGEYQSPMVHALAHAMNHALGNVGKTVVYTDPIEAHPVDQLQSLSELVQDMEAGRVNLLMILGGNPVYDAPADLIFRDRLSRVGLRIHLSLYNDETSELCHWHIPAAHYLESWSDPRAFDGTANIVQPLIAPLYGGKTAHELLAALLDQPERSGYEIVRDYWRNHQADAGTGREQQRADAATR